MATPGQVFASLIILFISVSADLVVYEEGYTVTTILDGNRKAINPHSVAPLSPSSRDLLLLDSAASSFYILSFLDSRESVVKKYSGNGKAGFTDGRLDSAEFNKPKSFTIDMKGNVYVADKNNHAIRKISKSGVTTIAGGSSQKPGHADGPARNASFSDDFELTLVPESCALIISDHGNKLLRQINLKVEDCANDSTSVLGMASAWLLTVALVISCLFGLIVGFFVRPYVAFHEGSNRIHYSGTWKHFQTNWGRRVVILCFDIRSAIVSSTSYALARRLIKLGLSQLTLMFSLDKVELRKQPSNYVSLIDDHIIGCNTVNKSQMYADQLKDLVCFNGGVESSHTSTRLLEQTCETVEPGDDLYNNHEKIERMIHGNLICFAEQAESTILTDQVRSNTMTGSKKDKIY